MGDKVRAIFAATRGAVTKLMRDNGRRVHGGTLRPALHPGL